MRILLRKPKGQIAVLTVIALPVMIGALALCCDVLLMYANWQSMQKAADAAVLAGASFLNGIDSVQDSVAITQATNYVEKNGIVASEIASGPTVSSDHTQISITLSRNAPYFFGRIFGLSTAPITVSATAAIKPIAGATGPSLLPIGYACASGNVPCGLTTGAQVPLPGENSGPPGQSKLSPGNWGGLRFPDMSSTGRPQFISAVENGYSGAPIMLGDSSGVTSDTGSYIDSATQAGLTSRYNSGSQTPSAPYDTTDSRIIEIPMVDSWPNGSQTLDITGFITMVVVPDGHGTFYGQVIDVVVSDAIPDSKAQNNGGPYAPVLIK
jgi:Flp pilus assembly protein TadG